jgi:hypothetical protein
MAAKRWIVRGVVRGGVIVPDPDAQLPEGAQVQIVLSLADVAPELQAELSAWDQASEEAWALIEEWERENPA